jgi:hypothetical protein
MMIIIYLFIYLKRGLLRVHTNLEEDPPNPPTNTVAGVAGESSLSNKEHVEGLTDEETEDEGWRGSLLSITTGLMTFEYIANNRSWKDLIFFFFFAYLLNQAHCSKTFPKHFRACHFFSPQPIRN